MTNTYQRSLTKLGGNHQIGLPLATYSAVVQLAKLKKTSYSAAVLGAVDGVLKEHAKGRGYPHIPQPFRADYMLPLGDALTFSLYHPELPDTLLLASELRKLANHLLGPEVSRHGDFHHTIAADGRELQVRRRGRVVHLHVGEGHTSLSVPEAKAVGQAFNEVIDHAHASGHA